MLLTAISAFFLTLFYIEGAMIIAGLVGMVAAALLEKKVSKGLNK